MTLKKYIPFLIYLLLILGCFAIVILTGKLTGQEEEAKQSETSREISEAETESPSETAAPSREKEPEESRSELPAETPDRRQYRQEWAEETEAVPEEESYEPPVLMLASDLHYISANTHDGGTAFEEMVKQDDGKISRYSDVLIDALVEEAIAKKPSALVLTGDITLNGERENHLGLAEKLGRAVEAGIPVLVVPGNHDIKNRNAATYYGGMREPAEYLENAEDFVDIYHACGYDQAFVRDENSLSYLYALDETHWMLMLDTCQYEDYNHVNGRLKPETLAWLEDYLLLAREQGIMVLPVGHHNLLSESRLYTTECTMENHRDIVRLFEKYEIPLYISGHLHAQRIKKHKQEPGVAAEAYGIAEIVLSPYSIPPCQYGRLEWEADGGMCFETEKPDVAAYAGSQGLEDENLLQFSEYGPEYLKGIAENQARKTLRSIPEELKDEMVSLYGQLYYDYCAGNQMSRDQVQATRAYRLWERIDPDNRYVKDMGQMMEDVRREQHDWSRQGIPKEKDEGPVDKKGG